MCSNGVSAFTVPWSKSPRAIGCTFPCKVVTCASSIRPATRLLGVCARADVPHPQISNKAKREKHNLTCFGIHILQDAAARKSAHSADFGVSGLSACRGKPGNLFAGLELPKFERSQCGVRLCDE